MSTNKEKIFLSELRLRTSQVVSIEGGLSFFTELARLVNWMLNVQESFKGIEYLEEQALVAKLDKKKAERELFDACLSLWDEFKLLVSEAAARKHIGSANRFKDYDPIEQVKMIVKQNSVSNADFLYHELRWMVEVLLSSNTYRERVERYLYYHIRNKLPEFSGGDAYNAYLKFVESENNLKTMMKKSVWGAWEHLKYVQYLATEKDWTIQLSEWAKVYKKQEYVICLYRVGDYLVDCILRVEGRKSTISVDDANSLETPIMNCVGYVIKINGTDLSFSPDKNPSGIGTSKAGEFAIAVANSGENGITYQEAKKILDSKDPSSNLITINNRLRRMRIGAEKGGLVQLIKCGKGMKCRVLFKVVPFTVFYEKK